MDAKLKARIQYAKSISAHFRENALDAVRREDYANAAKSKAFADGADRIIDIWENFNQMDESDNQQSNH